MSKLYKSTLLFSNLSSPTATAASKVSDNGIINDQLAFQLDIFLNCFMIQLLCLFGIVGNAINISVLSYRGLKDANIMLFSLSVIDMLGSFFRQIRRLKCLVAVFDIPSSVTADTFGFVFFILLDNWCLALGIFHVTAIAAERCWAVCSPFTVASVFTPSRVRIMLVSLYVYTVVILSPLFYRLSYTWDKDMTSNATVARIAYTSFYSSNAEAINLFSTIFYNSISTTAPLMAILICSIIIIFKLVLDRPQEMTNISRSDSKRLKDRKVVKMLVTVCMATVVSCLPTSIMAMYLVYSGTSLFTTNLYYIIRSTQDIFYQFSASVNFIIYVSLSSKFKKLYKDLFLSCLYKRKQKNFKNFRIRIEQFK